MNADANNKADKDKVEEIVRNQLSGGKHTEATIISSSTAGLKKPPPPSSSPPLSPKRAHVDMTGSIRSPNGVISRLSNNYNKKRSPRKQQGNESLNKHRFRYSSNTSDDEYNWESSDMDFSNGATGSMELLVQQIHDQRVKLSSNPSAVIATEASSSSTVQAVARAPPKSHQLSSSSEKPPRTSKPAMVPGAVSIDLSGRTEKEDEIFDSSTELEASAIMHLQAIPVDESMEHARMKEMEKQLQREHSRRLSLERKVAQSERKNKPSHHKSWVKERMPIAMALLIILSAIAVGLYFLLAPKDTENGQNASYFIFNPPTQTECEAIENGLAVPNQDSYSTLTMAMTCDVSYNGDRVDSVEDVIMEVTKAYKETILPALVGCYDEDGYFERYFNNTFTENRYLVANAKLQSVHRELSDCNPEEPTPCVRITGNFLFWTKAEISFVEMISLVQYNFGPKFLKGLKEGGVITNYNLVSFGPSQHVDDGAEDSLHPPPTAEECTAVLNGEPVPNQDQYPTLVADATIDITYTSMDQPNDELLLEVRNKLDSSIATMVGCTSMGREISSSVPIETRYAVANLRTIYLKQNSLECNSESAQPCVQVEARFFAWLKTELEVFDLLSVVHNSFRPALIETIRSSDLIEDVMLISAGPAPVQFEFPPPTEEECDAMINGEAVPGRDNYFSQRADTIIDVSTHGPWEDSVDEVLMEVRNTWQTLVMPTLAGCMDETDETWQKSTKTTERYLTVDSELLNVSHVLGECTEGYPRPCLRVEIRTQMWLKKEFDFFRIINLIDKNYGPALMAKVGNRDDNSTSIIKQAEVFLFAPVLTGPIPGDDIADPPQLDYEFEFPPPTKEECEAIVNGTSVPGQDEYFMQFIDSVIDVSTHEPWEGSLDGVLLEVRNAWQSIVHPTLAGCFDTPASLSTSTVTSDRYVFGNAVVQDVNRALDGVCEASDSMLCVRIGIRAKIFLKKSMNFMEIVSVIDRNYGSGFLENVGDRNDTSAIIKQVEMVSMRPVL